MAGRLEHPPGKGRNDLIEDLIAEALDEKYAHISRHDFRMLDYVKCGFSFKEVGEMFGITAKWVKKRLQRL